MKTKVFAVYDSKAEAYLQPFFSTTVGMAMRSFGDAVKDQGHQFHKHAEDYTLFQIGEFHDDTARLEPLAILVPLGTALEYLSKGDGEVSPLFQSRK